MFNFLKKKEVLKPFYITTTLPYVNAKPHVGFAMEAVRADVVARYERMKRQIELGEEINSGLARDDVFFNTGTDEHGIKVWQKAQEEGKDTQEFVDELAKNFLDLSDQLNISYDKFIRTTDEDHVKAAQKFWEVCDERGYIYKKEYEGLYCVGCEMFINEKDLVNGECEYHPGKKLEKISEENYFFKYSALAQDLLDLYAKGELVIPETRLKEIKTLVENGLEDFSISRLKEKMPWGIPVPGDDEHVMYVWFDALVNYISTLGWTGDVDGFKKFWKEGTTVQYCGKDNLQFQAARWQAMLLSVGLPTTDTVIINGFITADGVKMSKSLGNVIDPVEYINEFGVDALRYYLIRELHPFEDSSFTRDRFIESYNANLANGVGNVVSRVLTMAVNNGVEMETLDVKDVWGDAKEYHKSFSEFNLQKASDEVWKIVKDIDEKIAETEPFKLIKTDEVAAKKIISDLVKEVYRLGVLLEPFIPETAGKIREAVVRGEKPEALFMRV